MADYHAPPELSASSQVKKLADFWHPTGGPSCAVAVGRETPLGEFLERYPVEILVHTWDLAAATGQAAVLDPGLVRDALETAQQFAPVGRAAGLVGPECAVARDAGDLTRLLAIFGRSIS